MTSRIRILHSVGHLARGGIETWLHEMVRRLDAERFEHHVMVWTAEEEAFTAAFREAGARIVVCREHSNPVRLVANLRKLLAQNGPYDLLHTHGTHFQGFLMAAAASLGLRRRIEHSHNDIRPVVARAGLPYRAYAAMGYGLIRRLATRGVGVSELAAECAFGRKWRNDSRWQLMYCGVNFEPFFRAPDEGLRAELGIPQGKRVVGHVGRYVPQKNHKLLVRIAAELARRGAETHFLLIGDGPLRGTIMQEITERKLTENFTFVPDTTEIPRYLVSAMDCFLFPSLHEGVGLAAVEAQAAGLPVILASEVPAEAAVNAATTQRVSVQDPPTLWANAIERVPPRQSSLNPAFQQIFRDSRFNLDQNARKLAHLYDEVMLR